ncbi:lipocalin family protein [Pedobacter polysacchareus]|uniref:lipocalin family protein n=1 Tax=Pedobacter polysacchareus TaxID=2861973 RepID=UPI0021029EEC|nr:lipocalin family protein [Pedobacter polysacchareus]
MKQIINMNNTGKNVLYLSLALSTCAILFNACKVSIPKGAKAVKPFDSKRYLGKWYEIARLDFKYEKNLNNVTATYTEKDKGQIQVDNRGYDTVKKQWKQSIGKAKLVKGTDQGRLKVSFFGPFYAGYNVIAIDTDYQYALVAGNNLNYLWILSRTSAIPESVKEDYLAQAKKLGYRTEDLVWTVHHPQ